MTREASSGKQLSLRILTPAETLLEVTGLNWVQVRLADGGGLGIWPNHAPLLGETVAAPLRYADVQGEHRLNLASGILQIEQNVVTIFTSGLMAEEMPDRPDQVPGVDEMRFDRLTRVLLETLGAQAEGILEADDEATE